MKKITVVVGDCKLNLDEFGRLNIEHFSTYGQHFSVEFSEDVKAAFIAFTSLVIEREEE